MNTKNTTFSLPCRAASVRGQLKHSYLTNTICLKTKPDRLKVSMTCEENGNSRHHIIRNQIHELLDLMDNPEEGFSPAQLLDQLPPFYNLTQNKLSLLKAQVHQQYVQDFQMAWRKEKLDKISTRFLAALDSFLSRPGTIARMEKVHTTALLLIAELETLPKGIWLWKTERNEYKVP